LISTIIVVLKSFLDVITLDRHDFSRYRTRNRKAFTNHFPNACSQNSGCNITA